MQQRQPLQRLRQRQQVAFVAVTQQLVCRVVQFQLQGFGTLGDPAGELRLFRRLATDVSAVRAERLEPGTVFLRFGQAWPTQHQQNVVMQQCGQFDQLFADRCRRPVLREDQQQRLTAGEQAHGLTDAEDGIPIGMGVERNAVMLGELLLLGRVADQILAFLQQ
ncbi:hypothetical protein D3C78_1320660 [compost metagenome]